MTKKRRRYAGRDVVCPYFRREEERALVCNGCRDGQWVRIMFRDVTLKKKHMATYCHRYEYPGCPYAQAAEIGEEEPED